MSWQAQTAVNHHSKQRNLPLFRLLLYLAEHADEDGRIDPAPSQDTLAAFFKCSDRTIRNRLAALIQTGELEQVRVGSGPGNPSAYQIRLDMPQPAADKGGRMVEANPGSVSTFADELAALKVEISELKVEISELKVEKVEAKGGKGGNERWKGHSCKSADDPSSIHFDPGEIAPAREQPPPPPESPPAPFSAEVGTLVEMVNALVLATGKSGHFFWEELKAEAETLLTAGYSPQQLTIHYGRSSPNGHWNWYHNDWRGRKGDFPKPGEIRATISGAANWRPTLQRADDFLADIATFTE